MRNFPYFFYCITLIHSNILLIKRWSVDVSKSKVLTIRGPIIWYLRSKYLRYLYVSYFYYKVRIGDFDILLSPMQYTEYSQSWGLYWKHGLPVGCNMEEKMGISPCLRLVQYQHSWSILAVCISLWYSNHNSKLFCKSMT